MSNSRHYNEDVVTTGADASLNWNLKTMDYEAYIRQFVIGIQKYLHQERFRENSNKMQITR